MPFNYIVYTSFCLFLTNSIVCGACCQAFVNRLYQFAFHLGQQWAVHTNTSPHLKKKVRSSFSRIKYYISLCRIYIFQYDFLSSHIAAYVTISHMDTFVHLRHYVEHCCIKLPFESHELLYDNVIKILVKLSYWDLQMPQELSSAQAKDFRGIDLVFFHFLSVLKETKKKVTLPSTENTL